MEFHNTVKKYLSKQNLERWSLQPQKNVLYNNIIVIPALDELENIPKLLNSLSENSEKYLKITFVIIIVNNTQNTSNEIKIKNLQLLDHLNVNSSLNFPKLNIGYIDAASERKTLVNKHGGVGLARKIGMDIALSYFNYSNSKKNILISLDADCLVDPNYLEVIIERFANENIYSAVVNYAHTFPEDLSRKSAIINYEIFLRYYILGLKYACSNFDHHSIGSTIVCDAESYVKVGGMNKKKGGEDFYFLEKLAKITEIEKITETTVYPSARISERVPFGTGPRIKRFLENNNDEYLLYSPQSFEILKKWLLLFDFGKLDLNKIGFSEDQIKLRGIDHNCKIRENWINEIIQKAKIIDYSLYQFLIEQNFTIDWNNIIANSKSIVQLEKQKNNWMDGFKTLKLIHYLKENNHPNIKMFLALNELLNKMSVKFDFESFEDIPSVEVQIKYLKLLRKLT